VEQNTGKLMLLGEVTLDDEIGMPDTAEPMELWQSPSELRAHLCPELMAEVVDDMRKSLSSWSAATAARAVGVAAWMGSRTLSGNHDKIMQDMGTCWHNEPICTSVVIIFWQRYLCAFANLVNQGRRDDEAICCSEMILRFMPLKADRVLPGQLMKTMAASGFVPLARMPQIFQSVAMPCMQPVPVQMPQFATQPVQLPMPQAVLSPVVPPQPSFERPFTFGERVLYWSESMGRWIDAAIQGQHLDNNGVPVAYDLDVKPMADAAKIKRPSQLPPEARSTPPSPPPRNQPNHGTATPPHEQVAMPRKNAAGLISLIRAAIDEGWFSGADIEKAVIAGRAKENGFSGEDIERAVLANRQKENVFASEGINNEVLASRVKSITGREEMFDASDPTGCVAKI